MRMAYTNERSRLSNWPSVFDVEKCCSGLFAPL
jgi:hypothetical protein